MSGCDGSGIGLSGALRHLHGLAAGLHGVIQGWLGGLHIVLRGLFLGFFFNLSFPLLLLLLLMFDFKLFIALRGDLDLITNAVIDLWLALC